MHREKDVITTSGAGTLSRRRFLKAAAILGLAGTTATVTQFPSLGKAQESSTSQRVPQRPFGASKIPVSVLSLGGMFDTGSNQTLLRQALRWGVTYWDTADCYGGGRSEEGIGAFFARFPETRKEVFLVTKSDARDPAGMTKLLQRSLERMQTDWIDLYFLHAVDDIKELTQDVRRWAEQAKASGKIRLFGFSTHANMAQCLEGAARLGWVDGIMFTYNFRLMHDDAMKRAIDRCVAAGIGLTAMKTQGGGPFRADSSAEGALAEKLLARGFTDKQAKLKAVWEDTRIASICSQMPTMTILMSNVAAALDRTSLSREEQNELRHYAEATRSQYCAGCAAVCAHAAQAPIFDMMRSLMYARDYGDMAAACEVLQPLAQGGVFATLNEARLKEAERRCPHGLPLRRLVSEAAQLARNLKISV
ncbi:MAG: aldo/keto reductase [Desulfosoma sp.]